MPDSVTTPDPEAASTRITRVDAERKHLEGLFKDRINFHLVFASLFMVGLSKIDDLGVRVGALATITVVSALMAVALLRTYKLVRQALDEIKSKDPLHPYSRYQENVRWPPNANGTLLWIPFLLSIFFLIMTATYGWTWINAPHEAKTQSNTCTMFQVEDRSDRHITSEGEPSKTPVTGTGRGTVRGTGKDGKR
jgi:hypothetical protein